MTFKKGVKESVLTTQFDNNAAGLKAFNAYLVKQAVTYENTLLIIKNTGIYHRLIWEFYTTYLLPVYIGNAADLKWSFGIARTKSEKVDCIRLCDYAYKKQEDLKPMPALNKSCVTLKDLLSNRSKLLSQKNAIKQTLNKLKKSNDKATQKLMETVNKAVLDGLKKSIKYIYIDRNA